MSRTTNIIPVALAILACSSMAVAGVIHVPAGQPTIQQGIGAASGGDTVLVAPDTYTGALNRDLDFGGTDLLLISESGSDVTIIDCESSGRGFFFHSGEDTTAVVRGFTITNAVADSGAGAYCSGGSNPKFEQCKFLGNVAQIRGGGLFCNGSSPIVRNCEFQQDTAEQVTPSKGYGGGVACVSSSAPLIVDTDFTQNYAEGGGGGLNADFSPLELLRCDFVDNQLGEFGTGAGARIFDSNGATVTGCEFRENGADNVVVGAGLGVYYSTIAITDCDFIDNTAGASGGMHMTGASTSTLTGCTFIGNTGTWDAAGGLQCFSGADATVANCTFADNGTHNVWCDTASPTIQYCILAFSTTGLAVYCETGTETPYIHHCFVYGNAESDTLCGGNYHDIVNADPLFCDMDGGDLTLCSDSPCLAGATWGSLVGARDQGCGPCGNATEPATWGSIKATYR
jgi:hypothetical protein